MFIPTKDTRPFDRELKFTEVYKENLHAHKAVREEKCMAVQLDTYFIPPRADDLIAGRIDRPWVAFAPCFEGDSVDKVGYCIDIAGSEALLEDLIRQGLDKEYTDRVREMIDFWKTENTNTKIRNRFPASWEGSMGRDNYFCDNAAIHPLYRIAGVNLDNKKLLHLGLGGLIREALSLADKTTDPDKEAFYRSVAGALRSVSRVLKDYANYAKTQAEAVPEKREHYLAMAQACENASEKPAGTLREAIQLVCVYMLSTRAVEIGRLDDYLSEYYAKDLENGTLTHDEAVALVDNFFSIIEKERGRDTRAIIGGFGRENPEEADQFALLVLDVLEQRQGHFYPQVSLRRYNGMDERVWTRSLELLGTGCTFPLLYNDDVNVPSVMRAMDVSRKVAEQYSFFGCGEYMLATLSLGTPNTALNVAKVLEITLHNGVNPSTGAPCGLPQEPLTDRSTFEDVSRAYKRQLDFFIDISGGFEELLYDVCAEEACFLLDSCLQNCCMERGLSMVEGGIYHLGGTVETYGNVTAYDSLSAIRDVVYEKGAMTLTELVKALDANFVGYEDKRALLLAAPKFGNDDDRADSIATEFHEFICNAVRGQRAKTRLDSFLVVIINNNMNVVLGAYVGATPDGRLSGVFLSNGNSPYNGRDKQGVTALIHSMTKMDTSIHAGGNQNLKFSKGMFEHQGAQIRALLQAFFDLGGQQTNLSVVSQEELEDALVHPELHENLVVRVGGFTARFIDLDKQTQQDVLLRTAY